MNNIQLFTNNTFGQIRAVYQNGEPYVMLRGYFRIVEQKYVKPDGDTCINIKTLVYQKGLDYIRKIIKEC